MKYHCVESATECRNLNRHCFLLSDKPLLCSTGLLDALDKELNTYAMRVKEWYGWHFPELVKHINDNVLYSKLVMKLGMFCTCFLGLCLLVFAGGKCTLIAFSPIF